MEANNRHIAMSPLGNDTSFHDGQCFWMIDLYEDTGELFHRTMAYQIAVDMNLVFRVDFSDLGNLIPIQSSADDGGKKISSQSEF